MFSLMTRGPKKIFYYRFQVKHKKYFATTGTTLKGEAWAIAKKAYEDACKEAEGSKQPCTMKELVKLWLNANPKKGGLIEIGVSEKHWKAIETFGEKYLGETKDLLVTQLNASVVRNARDAYSAGKAPSSANTWLRYMKLICKFAIAEGMMKEMPWKLKPLPKQKKPRTNLPDGLARKWLKVAEVTARVGNRWAIGTCLRLMMDLGLRESEALNARWEFIDWEAKRYLVGRYVDGLFVTKGREAARIPMSSALLEHLAKQKQVEGLILPNDEGHPHASGFCRKAIAAANAACNTLGLSPHRLRSSFATSHSSIGTPIREIQEMLQGSMDAWERTVERLFRAGAFITERACGDFVSDLEELEAELAKDVADHPERAISRYETLLARRLLRKGRRTG